VIATSIGAAHLTAAMAALVLGTMVMGAAKGTLFHRMTGAGYAAAMIIVNLSALAIYRLTRHFEAFHALALLNFALVTGGVVAALMRRSGWLSIHYQCMAWSYIGLLAATGSEVVIRLGTKSGLIRGPWQIMAAGVALAVLATAAGFVLLPRLRRSRMQYRESDFAL
jgi:uncharacterized membrane protein